MAVKSTKSLLVDLKGRHFDVPVSDIEDSARRTYTDVDAVSVSQMLSSSEKPARDRLTIYNQYMYMMSDPIVGQALNLHVTQSLGGHETTGDVVFIEARPDISPSEKKMVEEIADDLMDIINENVYQMAFWGVAFGDAYSRLFAEKNEGIKHIEVSDFYMPAFITAFEQGGQTVGYHISIDRKMRTLTPLQLARLKMPRMGWTPQLRLQHNYILEAIEQDDISLHKPLPATIGGSFCEMAETPFFLLQSALVGLSSGRILDSIRESMIGLNMSDMTADQQQAFFNNITKILKASKKKAEEAIAKKQPVMEKILHIVPTWQEKQLYSIDAGGSLSNNNGNAYTIDDVMFYAKLLAGALGIDLSMLGFSDILSGGLGDGGFFRVSAQSGQRARLIRRGVSSWINHVIDVHCYYKYGGVFTQNKRPYDLVFVGATSSLERENQETRERKATASATVIQVIGMLKEQGANEKVAQHFMQEQMGIDEEDARLYATMLSASSPEGGVEDEGADLV